MIRYAASLMAVLEQSEYRRLETPRILLEVPSVEHVDGIFQSFASDPEVTKYLAWPPAQTLADCAASMAGRVRRLQAREELSWILVLRATGVVFGSLSLWPRSDGVEIGFAIARPSWGQGLAVEAALAAIAWAVVALRPHRIWGSCDPENRRSARVLEKMGLIEIRLERSNKVRPNVSGSPRDSRIFELALDAA